MLALLRSAWVLKSAPESHPGLILHHTSRHGSETYIQHHRLPQVIGMSLFRLVHPSSIKTCTNTLETRNCVSVDWTVHPKGTLFWIPWVIMWWISHSISQRANIESEILDVLSKPVENCSGTHGDIISRPYTFDWLQMLLSSQDSHGSCFPKWSRQVGNKPRLGWIMPKEQDKMETLSVSWTCSKAN